MAQGRLYSEAHGGPGIHGRHRVPLLVGVTGESVVYRQEQGGDPRSSWARTITPGSREREPRDYFEGYRGAQGARSSGSCANPLTGSRVTAARTDRPPAGSAEGSATRSPAQAGACAAAPPPLLPPSFPTGLGRRRRRRGDVRALGQLL